MNEPRAAARSGPYAAFNQAIADGRLGGNPTDTAPPQAPRRRMPGVRDESALPVAQMVAAGRDTRSPARRRPAAKSNRA